MAHLASTMELDLGLQACLDERHGSTAELHSYVLSHGILEIAVKQETESDWILIQCLDTRYLRLPTAWRSAHLSLRRFDDGRLGYYLLEDQRAGVQIACEEVAIERAGLALDASNPVSLPQQTCISHLVRTIDKWSGSGGLLHSYSAACSTLSVSLTNRRFTKGVIVRCIATRRIVAPGGWPSANLSLYRHEEGEGGYFLVRDEAAGVEIACLAVEVEPFEEWLKAR